MLHMSLHGFLCCSKRGFGNFKHSQLYWWPARYEWPASLWFCRLKRPQSFTYLLHLMLIFFQTHWQRWERHVLQRVERIQSIKRSCGSQTRWKGQICFEYAVERRSQGSQRRDECFRITLLSIFVFKLSLTMPLCSWLLELRGYTASKTLQERTWHIAAGTLHPNYVNQDCKWQPVSTWLPLYDPR